MTDRELTIKLDDRTMRANIEEMSIETRVYGPRRVTVTGTVINEVNKPTKLQYYPTAMKYKRVIYSGPATIVLWEDGSKTVVKCDECDVYNPALGLALCFMKKALGNSSRHLNDVLHREGF